MLQVVDAMTDKKSPYEYQREVDPYPENGTHTFVQWQGTNVCMDFHCKCGMHMHFDTDFLFFVQCCGCNTKYIMSSYVRAIEVPPELDEQVSKESCLWTTEGEDGDAIRVNEL